MIIGLTPCVEERTTPVAWNEHVTYTAARIRKFDQVLQEFSEAMQVHYVGLLQPVMESQQKMELLPDGLHPNDQGHQLMAEIIGNDLQQLIEA